jgi:hypothetical protein
MWLFRHDDFLHDGDRANHLREITPILKRHKIVDPNAD